MSSGKILLGALAGLAVGATLGILFAPDKGSSTRKKIIKKGDDYAEELGDKFKDFINDTKETFESAQGEAMHRAKNVKAKAKETFAEEINTIK